MEDAAAGGSDPLSGLLSQVQQLTQAVLVLQQQTAANAATLAVSATPPTRCPVNPPDRFGGNVDEFPAFLAQCELYMELRDRDFTTDKTKVCFILSLLKGQAAKWATPLLVGSSPLLSNYQGFKAHFSAAYANPVKAETANRKIRALSQQKTSVSQYTTEFQLITQDLAWNEAALIDQYTEGLSDEILDELARSERPTTLQDLIHLCLRIDGRLQSRRQNRKQYTSSSRTLPTPPRAPAPGPSMPSPDTEPMQLGVARPRLTPEEKLRRRTQHLCLYCGEAGHFSVSCPAKQKRMTVPAPGVKGQPQA